MHPTLLLQTIALVGGTVHSQVPGQEAQVATILMEGDRIQAVGVDLAVPEGAQIVDIEGLHVIPGLIDGQINHDPEHDALYLRSGVTLARDTGNDLRAILEESRPVLRNRVPGPELYICGQVFDGQGSASTDALRLKNAEVVPTVLDFLFNALTEAQVELDYLSFLDTLPTDAWAALIHEARQRKIDVVGPVPRGITLEQALQKGQAGFLGLQAVLPAGSSWLELDQVALTANVRALVDSQASMTPLLTAYGRMLPEHDAEAAMQVMGPYYEGTWRNDLQQWQEGLNPEKRAELEKAVAAQGRVLRMLHEAGASLVPGSGSPNPWILPGQGLVDELELWARAGIDRTSVLAYATREAARSLGVLSERGTLEAGKIADIVVLGSDPTQSLAGLRKPEIVVMRGQLIERKELRKRITDLIVRQETIRADLEKEIVVPMPNATAGDLVLQGTAETRTLGSRSSVEHFVVRKLDQDRWLYATRMIHPKTVVEEAKEVHLVQLMNGNLLERFDLRISAVGVQTVSGAKPGPEVPEGSSLTGQEGAADIVNKPLGILQIKGTIIEGTQIMNIEHRKDGVFLSSLRSKDVLTSVDVSLVLNSMIAAKHCPPGPSFVVSFEGSTLEPIVDRWNLVVREDDHLVQMHTTRGALAFGLNANGAIVFAGRERGTSQLYAYPLEDLKTFGGPGLALPPERVFIQSEEVTNPKMEAAPVEADAPR